MPPRPTLGRTLSNKSGALDDDKARRQLIETIKQAVRGNTRGEHEKTTLDRQQSHSDISMVLVRFSMPCASCITSGCFGFETVQVWSSSMRCSTPMSACKTHTCSTILHSGMTMSVSVLHGSTLCRSSWGGASPCYLDALRIHHVLSHVLQLLSALSQDVKIARKDSLPTVAHLSGSHSTS